VRGLWIRVDEPGRSPPARWRPTRLGADCGGRPTRFRRVTCAVRPQPPIPSRKVIPSPRPP
jgi:hypothetical protein